ncbi:unnamed protein product, partial [Mesorhabditis belari]|uniref:PCI domain-containing protein n=1 Tax=Mesorhabditis belari TaxID=2138241 RepID=A0AAF3EWZ9_9BILA
MSEQRTPITVAPIPTGEKSEFSDLAHLAAQVGDGRLLKMEVDYTKNVDDALPKADQMAKSGNVAGAVESLSALEKQSRLGCDMKSNTRIVQHMVKLCFDSQKWQLLNDTIISLSKKRLLIKVAIARMVRDCCAMVENMPNEELKMSLIDTLRTVTAGKIYVEVERARLTSYVVKKLEAQEKLDDATNMLLELQVEFLLEQMRLSIARKDHVRAAIISKKISTKFFAKDPNDDVQNLKLKYYELMIVIGLNDNAYLDVCRHYRAIQETPKVLADVEKSKMEAICKQYEALLRAGTPTCPATGVFESSESGNKRWEDLHLRVGEHNMRMIAKYYTQISFDRLAELLDFPVDEMEKFLCNLIVTGAIPNTVAKIHRPNRVVNLRARKAHVDHLDQWAHNVRQLTDTLNKVSHLILKEEMVHKNLEHVSIH